MNGRKVVHMENTNIFFDKSGIFDNFLALIASTFDAHSVLLFMPESENSAAKLVSFFSMSDKSVNQNAQLAQGKGLVGWILKNKQPLLYQIPEENQANLGYYLDDTEDSIHSFMGTFIAGNGALCLDSKKANFFSENQQKLLDSYGKILPQLFTIVNNSMQIHTAEDYFQLLEQLADLKKNYNGWSPYLRKLLQLLSSSLGFEYVAFTSLSDKKDHYYIDGEFPAITMNKEFGFGGGLVGWVYKNEEMIQNDGKENNRSLPLYSKNDGLPLFSATVCIPVRVEKNIAAVLCLASASPKEFDTDFKIIMRVISEDLAQFLEIVALRYRVHRMTKK